MNKEALDKLKKLPNGTIVKLTWHRDYTKHNDGVYITRFHSYQEKHDLFNFGHPYNVKTHKCTCGEAGFQSEEIVNVEPAEIDEMSNWFATCVSFQKSIIDTNGYDICEESGTLYALMKADNGEEIVWNISERKLYDSENS